MVCAAISVAGGPATSLSRRPALGLHSRRLLWARATSQYTYTMSRVAPRLSSTMVGAPTPDHDEARAGAQGGNWIGFDMIIISRNLEYSHWM